MSFLSETNLRIAIQKSGRLTEPCLDILRKMGLQFEHFENRLFASCRNFPIDIIFVRDNDIPEYVQDGIVDLGIVGSNVLFEKKHEVEILENLGFARCSLEIAVPKDGVLQKISQLKGKKIATSYPVSLEKYLRKNNISADIIEIRGSVEMSPSLGLADAICDLVSTGSTLRTNNLISLDRLFQSEAVLIGNKKGLKDKKKKDQIERILMRLQGYLTGKNKKYVMMNAPSKALEKIKQLIPGLKSPTVMPLATEGMIAIHSVVPEEKLWEVIEQLKKLGASGILVMDIETMVV